MKKTQSIRRRRSADRPIQTRQLKDGPRTARYGWRTLLSQEDVFCGDDRFPIPAYSEFMPGPYVGRKPYGELDPFLFIPGDDTRWRISEYQEALQLRPGLEEIGRHILGELRKLAQGQHAFSKALLADNPYWPETLAARAGSLQHERYVVLLPLALSRTMDDKGRVRWTLFGSSDQGPARAFWLSFRSGPDRELTEEEGTGVLKNLLSRVYRMAEKVTDLRRAGFRILPAERDPDFPAWGKEPLPSWAEHYLLSEKAPLKAVRYLLTFRPFARLPIHVQKAYLDGALHLLPFPGSLIFFGHAGYRHLARRLPQAMQIPLLIRFPVRQAASAGIRIPQSGWLDEPRPHGAPTPEVTHRHGPIVNRIKRSHRWHRSYRDEDEFASIEHTDRVSDALFCTDPEHLGLYGKPMARNAQIWTHGYHLLLNGPAQGRSRIEEADRALGSGGHFGYRLFFPPMRVGCYDVYWHRPLIAFFSHDAHEPTVLLDGPLGYLTASAQNERLDGTAVELWPHMDRRDLHQSAIELFSHEPAGHRRYTTVYNLRKLLEAHELLGGKPLLRSYARQLLTAPKEMTLDQWLDALLERAADPTRGRRFVRALRKRIRVKDPPIKTDAKTRRSRSHTFDQTSHRNFEKRYWNTIARLSNGQFLRKNNADVTGAFIPRKAGRDLDALADSLHEYHLDRIKQHDMTHRAHVGYHWFQWVTDFDFPWSEGWSRNQSGRARERNVVVIIPGQDRSKTVIMADHYDTAYMEDVYEKNGAKSARAAAAGADDNHSATAALMLAADVLLPLSRAGKLKHDVWLVHLTGEEFPSDCLGARHLVQRLVERNFAIDVDGFGRMDLSTVRVRGAFILDMVAHNNDHNRYVFQISPGEGSQAAHLAYRAHLANERWNRSVPIWNRVPQRKRARPYKRVASGRTMPRIAPYPHLYGEIRPSWHFASSLYNTDAQIFSDAGIPVVLFMEHYDIKRKGYHDTQDTMKNIDLDYGAALVAIAIETVVDVATSLE